MLARPPMSFSYSADARKSSGSSPISSFIQVLSAVIATLTLVFALTRMSGSSGQDNGQPGRTEDLTGASRPLSSIVRRASATAENTRPLSSIVRRAAATAENTRLGFFLEIGTHSGAVSASIRTQHLENKGWAGVCAVPFPEDFKNRKCKVVSSPVSGTSGQKVQVPDCSQNPCVDKEATTTGIVDLLSHSDAPPIIDYIALDTQGRELDILNNFPFDDFCARSWTVTHNYDDSTMPSIRQILEVAHGCRVREGAGEFWARCLCDKDKQDPTASTRAEDPLVTTVRMQASPPSREAGGVQAEPAQLRE